MIPETFEDFVFLAMKFLFTFVCYKQWQFPTRNNMGFSVLPLWHVGRQGGNQTCDLSTRGWPIYLCTTLFLNVEILDKRHASNSQTK